MDESKTDALEWERRTSERVSQVKDAHINEVRQLENNKNSFIESLNLKIQQLESELSQLKQQLTLKNKL